MSSTVTTKGQVTIPKPVREYLGIAPGAAVDFEVAEDGNVVVRPAGKAGKFKRPRSRFAQLRGSGKPLGMSSQEYMVLIRGYDEDASDPGFKPGSK